MMMKYGKISFLFLLFVSVSMFSQNIWTKQDAKSRLIRAKLEYRETLPTSFELFTINNNEINKKLTFSKSKEIIMELPTPNGIQRFLVKEASVFSDELAAKYPQIKSYVGVGIDDVTARVRFSKSKVGIHVMITSGKYPMYLIDPYTKDKKTSIAYFKNKNEKNKFECLFDGQNLAVKNRKIQKTVNANDGKLRTYRMALIGTAEYSQFHLTNQGVGAGETNQTKKTAVLSAMNVSMTRVNGIFERDLGVTMKLVSDNTDLIFLDAATDGLTNNDISALVNESQTKCDAVIGNANYDVGHVFAWVNDESGNGVAGGGVVCVTGEKAQGATMRKTPLGDRFDIDLVAHEIGHQFGANHTQNVDCNRYNATAVEPGSGSTIMGYAGFCDPNVQNISDAYFHAVSISEMWNHVITTATCAVETITNNAAPVANAGNDFTIPKSTPFVLKGSATDADAGNNLTYNWEQLDNQTATMPPNATNTVGPMFRSLPSSTSPNRYMPAISTVLGNTSSNWEVVPSVARTMNFSLTVRDNVLNGGAYARDDVKITVDGKSGPFLVTSQTIATTLNGNSTQTITWDVANTTAAPVNAANVNILLSTDGGMTFPNVLISNTPNNGSVDVTLPNITTTQARIKVEAANNIFYAVNSTNFSIDSAASVGDELFSNFKLFPNPSNGMITVSFDLQSSDVNIELFDLRGRKIKTSEFKAIDTSFSKALNYQSVAKGLYILKIANGNNRISKKIVID